MTRACYDDGKRERLMEARVVVLGDGDEEWNGIERVTLRIATTKGRGKRERTTMTERWGRIDD